VKHQENESVDKQARTDASSIFLKSLYPGRVHLFSLLF